LLCADPELARLSRLEHHPLPSPEPTSFVRLLRARLGRARLEEMRLVDEDRQAALRFAAAEGEFQLLFSILGPRTNVYLLDSALCVVGALRPLAETRSELSLREPWSGPASRPPREGEDRFEAEPDERFFAAVEELYGRLEAERNEDELRRRLLRALHRTGQALERKARFLNEDARGAQEAEQARRQGELLKSVLDRARPGQQQVQARDFETGAEVSIPLDPTLSPAANLEALFRRARKAQRRALRAAQQQGALEARREELDALRAELERAESLAAFSERPDVQRLLERHAPTAPRAPAAKPRPFRLGKREIPRRLAPRRYRSSDGLEIWVGRSDEGNDLLTTRLARGNDLFFHVSASPGSHVVLRTEGRVDPPSESLLEACELAVHASKQRRASRVDVLVTSIKNVRKPKGAKPGLVVVSGGKTLHLRHHPSRLERVLAARIDPEP
jgi:predicted ribosome quality control (RQC) complex YloA/Tae2 family protein